MAKDFRYELVIDGDSEPNTGEEPPQQLEQKPFAVSLLHAISPPLVVLSILFLALQWYSFPHTDPIFAVSNATITSFSVISGPTRVSGDLRLAFSMRNPNDAMTVDYELAFVSVLFRNASVIGNGRLPRFHQAEGEWAVVGARVALKAEYDVAYGVAVEREQGGVVRVDVVVSTRLTLRAPAWRRTMRYDEVRVYCDDVRIGFLNSSHSEVGYLLGGKTPCRIFMGVFRLL